MPSVKVDVPMKYINGNPHYRGEVLTYTVSEWNALSSNDKFGLQVQDFSDLIAQVVTQINSEGGGGDGGGGGGTGDGTGTGGPGLADAFQGEWTAKIYNKNEVVTRNKALYVANRETTADDDPAFAGVPVDIGGMGHRANANTYTGSDTVQYTEFTTGPSGLAVSAIEMWVGLLNNPSVQADVLLGITTQDRSLVLASAIPPGGPFSGDASMMATFEDPILLAANTTYNAYVDRSFHVGVGDPAVVPDGGVVDVGPSWTTYWGTATNWALMFRLWGPANMDGPWTRLIKGV